MTIVYMATYLIKKKKTLILKAPIEHILPTERFEELLKEFVI